jgi:GGDEF domain-containing protein
MSIGYSRFPNEAPDARSLMNQADIAMYQAKAAGKNIYRLYTPNMD